MSATRSARRIGFRDQHVGEPREECVFGCREEGRLVRPGNRLGVLGDYVLSVELVARKRKGARRRDRTEDLQRVATCLAHSSPLFIRPAM